MAAPPATAAVSSMLPEETDLPPAIATVPSVSLPASAAVSPVQPELMDPPTAPATVPPVLSEEMDSTPQTPVPSEEMDSPVQKRLLHIKVDYQ
jgi:hypothetical protein